MEWYTILLLVVVSFGILYYVYSYIVWKNKNEPVLLKRPRDTTEKQLSFPSRDLPPIEDNYTLSGWIYVRSFDTPASDHYNTILYMGSITTMRVQPWIGFSNKPTKPLAIAFSLRNGGVHYQELTTIPIRRWVHLAVVMDSETSLSFYLDGKLHTVIPLVSPVELLDAYNLTVFYTENNFEGAFTQLLVTHTAMRAEDIRREYLRGPAPVRISPDRWVEAIYNMIPKLRANIDASVNLSYDVADPDE